jgi:PAS domain S-box-containing protein
MPSVLPLNILIVDDDEDDFFITSDYIQHIKGPRKITTDWCFNYDDALDKICDSKYDLYLVDYRLGAKTGLDLIKDAVKNNCKEPIILLTGKGNQEIDMHAMDAGAVDYLLKSELNTEKLERCIRYAMGRYEFIKALKANEQKYRGIFEKSTDAVFVANPDLSFKDVNPATSEIFEYDKNELLQLNFYDLLANKNDQATINEQLTFNDEVADKAVELLTKSKQKITCVISISKEVDDKGEDYLQGIIHDITSLKKSEIASMQAEKLRATERLVRMLAHEVRNPLNNINLSIEQLDPELTSGDAKIFLDIISRNSKRINDLITELLNSSRQTEIVLSKTKLETVIDNSIAAAIDRINLQKIKLDLHYNNQESFVMADEEKLKIAVLNIIINAVEAMREKEGILTISLDSQDNQHLISITDNGIGIPEENIPKLFEPYYTSKRNGMGLGLASTLNILQAHKASIEVKSSSERGTTFIISMQKAP